MIGNLGVAIPGGGLSDADFSVIRVCLAHLRILCTIMMEFCLSMVCRKKKHNHWKIALGVIVPMLVVVGLLFVLISYRGGIEAGLANLARLLPLGYAFGAGMVASVNPCGVLLLPSFAFLQLKGDVEGRRFPPIIEKPAAVRIFLVCLPVNYWKISQTLLKFSIRD